MRFSPRKLFISSFVLLSFLSHLSSQGTIEKDFPTLDGFAESQWGMAYESLREKFQSLATNPEVTDKIEILQEEKDKKIHVRRNGIEYIYRFYKTPEIVKELRPKASGAENDPTIASQTEFRENGILFSVGVIFPFVESEKVGKKLEGKYGKPKKDTEGDIKGSGVVLWELVDGRDKPPRGGFILQWKEPYKNLPYSRRIDYFSATVKEMIATDYVDFFSARETKTLRDLIP